MGVATKKRLACAWLALGGTGGVTKQLEALSHATPVRQCEKVRWSGSRNSTRSLAAGTHLRSQLGASCGALKTVGDASSVSPSSTFSTGWKWDAYEEPVWWRYFGSVR